MSKLRSVETQILELQGSGEASQTSGFLRRLIAVHEQKLEALEEEQEKTKATLASLQLALAATDQGMALPLLGAESERFASLPYWQCAKEVLEDANQTMTAREITEAIQARDRDLGAQGISKVTNGLKAYLGDVFYREKPGSEFEYGLMDWQGSD
jgi:hypothetical protein